MKKELKTKQDYLDAHLKEFEAIQEDQKVKGIIFVEDNNVFLLNNEHGLYEPTNKSWKKYGYKYSHQRLVFEGTTSFFHSLTIEVEEEWKPKFGELVYVSDKNDYWGKNRKNIFLFEKDGLFHVLDRSKNSVKSFNSLDVEDDGYTVYKYKYVKQIESPKPIEITLEEAKSIIAKEKGVNVEQINLNFNIKQI